MRIPGLRRLRQSVRCLRSRFTDGALILGYHRVADVQEDPYRLCVSPQHFAEHLAVLRRHTQPMSLSALIDALDAGQLPDQAVVMTFDDGYADLLEHVRPLLDRHDVPATAFIVAGCLGRPFWWDELAGALLASGPSATPAPAPNTDAPPLGRSDGNRPERGADRASVRTRTVLATYRTLRQAPGEERERTIAELWAGQGDSPDVAGRLPRALTADEVVELASSGLFEIGSHTLSHATLASLSTARQHQEILESKRSLEELLQRPVRSFSYPDGSVSGETAELVRQAGFRCGCTSHQDIVHMRSDLFQLPRFWAGDWSGADFERWLLRRR
jgi:peptidoglycan/xylan/chitin deacetylase (PgdA/CDA1 family)